MAMCFLFTLPQMDGHSQRGAGSVETFPGGKAELPKGSKIEQDGQKVPQTPETLSPEPEALLLAGVASFGPRGAF